MMVEEVEFREDQRGFLRTEVIIDMFSLFLYWDCLYIWRSKARIHKF
jgi:hypothetical protein